MEWSADKHKGTPNQLGPSPSNPFYHVLECPVLMFQCSLIVCNDPTTPPLPPLLPSSLPYARIPSSPVILQWSLMTLWHLPFPLSSPALHKGNPTPLSPHSNFLSCPYLFNEWESLIHLVQFTFIASEDPTLLPHLPFSIPSSPSIMDLHTSVHRS